MRVGGACGPPPPFAAPLVPRYALTSGATPRVRAEPRSIGATRDIALLRASPRSANRTCSEWTLDAATFRARCAVIVGAKRPSCGGSPRKRARSEERAEQRTGAGGRRLPRHACV